MKLVDILARELKVWPQGARWILHDGANGCYADLGITSIGVGIDCSEFDGNPTSAVFEAGWQAAVDALKAESSPAWVGVGLPPIGIDVEVLSEYSHPRFDRFIGQQVHIVAHDVINGDPVAVFRMPIDGDDAEQDYHAMVAKSFRPIRTPEQIAADERERQVKSMLDFDLLNPKADIGVGMLSRKEFCEALYDAGYRKFEIVDN